MQYTRIPNQYRRVDVTRHLLEKEGGNGDRIERSQKILKYQ